MVASYFFGSDASNLIAHDTNKHADIFVRGRVNGVTQRVSVGTAGRQSSDDSGDQGMAISANGRLVAFTSDARNLVPGDRNYGEDIFVRD